MVALVTAITLTGSAAVIDGDTLRIGKERVRLFGVDAPELGQLCGEPEARISCGLKAADWLRNRVEGRRLDCSVVDRDRYSRIVARCRIAGLDIGGALVEAGWATAYREYGFDYVKAEARARAARRGMWAIGFVQPQDYRRARLKALPPQKPINPNCLVKGNVGSKGAKIFHLPDSRDYSAVRIDERRGERWFCSIAEATAAGWRPAR